MAEGALLPAASNPTPKVPPTDPAFAVASCLEALIASRVLEVPLRQRANFEGWLKIELASALRQYGLRPALEVRVPGAGCVADIALETAASHRVWLMLKTVSTSFRFAGVERRGRPLTENVKRVSNDVDKLRRAPEQDHRLIVFVVFPVSAESPRREQDWRRYRERLTALGIREEWSGFVRPPYSCEGWGLSWFVLRV